MSVRNYHIRNWSEGSFYYNWEQGNYQFYLMRPDWDYPDVRTCPCCINKMRSRVRGPKALKINNGLCVKSP